MGQFFLVLPSMKNLKEQIKRVHKVLWQLLGRYKVDENNFSKKSIFPMKNNFGQVLLVLPSMAHLR